MKEQIVSFKTAKLAKEKEFNELCSRAYKDGTIYYHKGTSYDSNFKKVKDYKLQRNSSFKTEIKCSAPTQSFLQKWLREKHNIDIVILPYINMEKNAGEVIGYTYKIWKNIDTDAIPESNNIWYKKYEEAFDNGLYNALQLIK